jgi:hypothetical protein
MAFIFARHFWRRKGSDFDSGLIFCSLLDQAKRESPKATGLEIILGIQFSFT